MSLLIVTSDKATDLTPETPLDTDLIP
jgi:hypothetical protein